MHSLNTPKVHRHRSSLSSRQLQRLADVQKFRQQTSIHLIQDIATSNTRSNSLSVIANIPREFSNSIVYIYIYTVHSRRFIGRLLKRGHSSEQSHWSFFFLYSRGRIQWRTQGNNRGSCLAQIWLV